MKKLQRYIGGIVPFFAAEGIQYVVAMFFSLMFSIIAAIKVNFETGTTDGTEYTKEYEKILSPETLYFIGVVGILACGIVFFFWYRKLIRGEVRGILRNVFTSKNIILFILLGLGCQLFVSGFLSLIKPLFSKIFSDYAETVKDLTSGSAIVVIFFMVLIAPIAEELIFRGVILHKTSKVIPFIGANLLQALLFGIYHGNIVQGIYATIIGFLLGIVYYKFKTIFAPILLHMIINASSLIAVFIPTNIYSYIAVMIFGGVLIVLSFFKIRPAEDNNGLKKI